jgi:hypothetical protein
MATIKYQEDEQGNKKIIVKTDPETSQQKVSCGCCDVRCDGCGTINSFFGGVSTLSFQLTFNYTSDDGEGNIESSSVSFNDLLYFTTDFDCFAFGSQTQTSQNSCKVGMIGLEVKNHNGYCMIIIAANAYIGDIFMQECSAQTGCNAASIEVLPEEVIGSHSLNTTECFYGNITGSFTLTIS